SVEKLARKTHEIELAELILCPSNFVLESIPERLRAARRCEVVPFGSPSLARGIEPKLHSNGKPLRILFAGALTQRKGLADVFAAMKLVDSKAIELVVMGSLLRPLEWYRKRWDRF